MVLESQLKLELILTLISVNFVSVKLAHGWLRYGVKFPPLGSASELLVGGGSIERQGVEA
jgi:hypothetical protein